MLHGIVKKHSKRLSNYQFLKKFRNIINYFCHILETCNIQWRERKRSLTNTETGWLSLTDWLIDRHTDKDLLTYWLTDSLKKSDWITEKVWLTNWQSLTD